MFLFKWSCRLIFYMFMLNLTTNITLLICISDNFQCIVTNTSWNSTSQIDGKHFQKYCSFKTSKGLGLSLCCPWFQLLYKVLFLSHIWWMLNVIVETVMAKIIRVLFLSQVVVQVLSWTQPVHFVVAVLVIIFDWWDNMESGSASVMINSYF